MEYIMDAPCYDDIWMLVESARGESLMVRRCLTLVGQIVNHHCSFFWNGERLDVPARGLVSRVMVIASPIFGASLECEAVLLMNSRSAPASSLRFRL